MSRFHRLTVGRVERETRDAVALTLVVPPELAGQFRHVQGQHLTVRAHIGSQEVRRSYSICSAVGDPDLRIAIKHVPGGLFSAWANQELVAGHVLEVMPPAGHFNVVLDPGARRDYLAVAAGSGITPILSILKTTLRAEPLSRFTLVYGNRASSTVLFKEELEDLKDRYLERLNLVFVLSREHQDIELFNGRIDGAKIRALCRHWIDLPSIDYAFVCGPLPMMEAVQAALADEGLAADRIKLELFAASAQEARRPPREHLVQGTNQCQVTIVQDGRTARFSMDKNAQSVLEAGLAAGLDLPYSCKAGVCSTCRCKRIEGEVDMDANFALEDYELARGFVLACQSYPVSDTLVLDYDQDT